MGRPKKNPIVEEVIEEIKEEVDNNIESVSVAINAFGGEVVTTTYKNGNTEYTIK